MPNDIEREYQRLAFWISNIDTKISFALGITGILLGFVLSNSELGKIIKKNILLLGEYEINSIIFILLLSINIILLVLAIWFFLRGLKAKINSKKFKQPGMIYPSNIFWGDIAKKKYSVYKYNLEFYGEEDWEEDLKSQIYINSLICNQKAIFYNRGINCLVFSIVSFVLYHVWLWFIL